MSNEDNQDNILPEELEEIQSIGKNLDTENPEFDILFQYGILNLALRDDHFASQLSRFLHEDKVLKKYLIFDNAPAQQIFILICKSIKEDGTRPHESQLRQLFTEFPNDEQSKLNITLDKILSMKINNDKFYKTYIGGFVRKVKLTNGIVEIQKAWKTNTKGLGVSNAITVMQEVMDSYNRVDFEDQNIVRMDDFDRLYAKRKDGQNDSKIPTGIKQLDEDLLGGLARETLTVVLSGTNVGKSIFCISLGVQALKAQDNYGKNRGFKVLHINLEGRSDEALFRYMANLAQVNLKAIATGKMDVEEAERVRAARELHGDRLLIRNMTGFGVTIEDLISYAREVYKDFKFDQLIVDYGQLLGTQQKTDAHRLAQAIVFRGLDSVSKEFNCAVVSPAQATRGAQENQNQGTFKRKGEEKNLPVMRSTDISEAMEIARVSAVILTLNRTDDEVEQGKLRVFLEKSREGAKNKQYGIFANYPMSDVITGKYYDPRATLIKEDEAVSEKDTVSLDNYDPEVLDSERIIFKLEEIDRLVEDFENLLKKENERKMDYSNEKKKDNANEDILEQCLKDIDKYRKEKKEIMKRSQEAIKIIDPNASEALLKQMEKSLKDLQKSTASDEQVQEQEKIVKRYRLSLKGKV